MLRIAAVGHGLSLKAAARKTQRVKSNSNRTGIDIAVVSNVGLMPTTVDQLVAARPVARTRVDAAV